MPSFAASPRNRACLYSALLLGLNFYFIHKLFFVDFTNNMQTNAGSFMAISRFILQQWPHLDWYPWWFAGEPFENSYTPLLHIIDAAFAWVTGCSTARAFNFVTGFFYLTGPVFLLLFAWRVSKSLETSFFAALLYTLFSPANLFSMFRHDVGGLWNPWRIRVLVYYGEGPHTTVLSVLPIALLFTYLAITTRKYLWCVAAAFSFAFLVLVNAFGAVDLGVGCACLILALGIKQIPRAAILTAAIGTAAYVWISPFLTPSLIHTISTNSQNVGGDFTSKAMLSTQCLILAGFVCVWIATRWVADYFTRFSLLCGYVFLAIVAFAAVWNRAALPQPHRYSLEMDLALSLAVAFSLRPLVVRLPRSAWALGLVLILIAAVHQTLHFRRYARAITPELDVTTSIEYKVAMAIDRQVGPLRAFVTGDAGTWLNVFSNTPQLNSGHDPFNPNWMEAIATYAIYSGQNAGARDAEMSVLWLKAFGCHAIYVPGPKSRLDVRPFNHPEKFYGVLPVLWHEEDDTIYSVPQRTKSLAHVVPEAATVKKRPINGLDTDETSRYVAALDDAAFPVADIAWSGPSKGHIDTKVRPGQVVSLQVTYDQGWIAAANGSPAEITRDGIGLMSIHTRCDGTCAIDFVFDGGFERKICRILSWSVSAGMLLGGFVALRKRPR